MTVNADIAKCKTGLDVSVRDFFENVKQWEEAPAQALSTFQLAAIAFRRDAEEVLGNATCGSELGGGSISVTWSS